MLDITPVVAAIFAFLVCAFSGKFFIPLLHKLKFGQTIKEDGPSWHKQKSGTPTMGGIMMITALVISLIAAIITSVAIKGKVSYEFNNTLKLSNFIAGIGLCLGMAAIGFIDDYIKVVKKRNLGLSAKQKTFLQAFVTAAYLASLGLGGMSTTWLPFIGNVSIVSGFGWIFWPIAFFFVYGFVNAVNLTDGIDGLASFITLVVSCAFMLAASLLGFAFTNMLSCVIAGCCAGFIVWNAHPAKVFMGDTGSMFLGGAVVALSFGIGRPIMLLLAGIVYLCEAFSVILQVAYFKKTKKRLFKMSPIHHHFELSGWKEEKIVFVFSFITFIACFIAIIPIIF